MVAPLTQEWLDLYVELAADLPARPGASARLQHTVAKTPQGDVAYTVAFEDGRPVAVTLGPSGDGEPDLSFAATYADALAMARGELDLHVGFMQGRVKAVGDLGALFAVLPATQSDEHRSVLAELARRTDA